MKYLIIILSFSIAMTPVQAGFCDLEQKQNADQGMSHHAGKDQPSAHDCCDADKPSTTEECEHFFQCGFCTAVVLGVSEISLPAAAWTMVYTSSLSAGVITPSHSTPPYRPPIS